MRPLFQQRGVERSLAGASAPYAMPVLMLISLLLVSCTQETKSSSSTKTTSTTPRLSQPERSQPAEKAGRLRVAISPYQDIAMLVNVKNLGLEKKYGTEVEFITLPWEDIPNAIASGGDAADVGFVGLTDYISKIENMNSTDTDPVIFVYPCLVFRGGGFVSFNPQVPEMNKSNINDVERMKKFLSYKIGVQRSSCFQMAIFLLAKKAGVRRSDLKLVDTTINDGLLAAQNGSLDMSSAGLTQRTEAVKRNGRVVLTIDTMDIVEVDGFACKKSTFDNRRKDVANLVRMWFDCTNYVVSDPDHNATATLAYLKKNAATQYTLAEYKKTISEEFFPKSVQEAESKLVSPDSPFSIQRQGQFIIEYLNDIGARAPKAPPASALHWPF